MSTPYDPQQPNSGPGSYSQQPQDLPGAHTQPGYGQQPPQGWHGQPQAPLTHAQARAQAQGARAQAKALRPWYKKKRFVLPLGLVALFALIGIAGSGGDNSAPTAGVPATTSSATAGTSAGAKPAADKVPAKSEAKAGAKIGDTVSAGDWDFKVTKYKCGMKSVGGQYANKKPQGQFCFLNVNATNNGDTEGTLNGDNQKLIDADGKEYSSDYEASVYEDPDSSLFLEGVNPGNTAKGLIVFDIPKKASPDKVSLAGGLFGSKTVTVDLR